MRTLFTLIAFCSLASAHGLIVTPTVTDTGIRVTVKYDDDTPAVKAKVFLRNKAKETLAEAETDETGLAILTRPASLVDCVVRAETEDLHAATVRLKVSPEAKPEEPTNRWVITAVGLVVITLLGAFVRIFLRMKRNPEKTIDAPK